MDSPQRIAFQGELGSYSHQACVESRPDHTPMPCASFEEAIETVRAEQAVLAMLPIENSTYGRVPEMHSLLPASGLHIVDEAFVRVHINLMALPGTRLEEIESVQSHPVLLGQCRAFLKARGICPVAGPDTAGSARQIKALGARRQGALATELAARIHGLNILARHIEDNTTNTTRFVVMSRTKVCPDWGSGPVKTTLLFEVRNIPAALYKAMGGFATEGINMTRLESFMVDNSFSATRFYTDVEAHPDDPRLQRAMGELAYFTQSIQILGTYPRRAAPGRDG